MHFVRFLGVFLLSVRDLLFLFRVCTSLPLYVCIWACRVVAKRPWDDMVIGTDIDVDHTSHTVL